MLLIGFISSVMFSVASSAASVQPQTYWVLGSYRDEGNAQLERQRLESLLSVAVEPRVAPSGLLRLTVPAPRLSQATVDRLEIGAWKIVLAVELSAETTVGTTVGTTIESAVKGVVELPDEVPEKRPDIVRIIASPAPHKLPNIQQGQSLSEYCRSLPGQGPSFCEPQRISEIEEKSVRLALRMSDLSDYCMHPDLAQDLVEVCRHLPR